MADETTKEAWLQQGRAAYHAWTRSPQFAQFDPDVPPEVAVRAFLPPPPQDRIEMVRPLPKEHRWWLEGWRAAAAKSTKT